VAPRGGTIYALAKEKLYRKERCEDYDDTGNYKGSAEVGRFPFLKTKT
jgi:hypothetical protein